MKKFLTILLLIALCFSFTGCVWIIHVHKDLSLSQPTENVEKIEIYNLGTLRIYYDGYYDEEWKTYKNKPEITIENFHSHIIPAKTIEGVVAKDFYERLKNMPASVEFFFVLAAVDPADPNHHGYAARIIYKNGEYDVISDWVQTYHNADGTSDGFGKTIIEADWTTFIEEYLDSAEQ